MTKEYTMDCQKPLKQKGNLFFLSLLVCWKEQSAVFMKQFMEKGEITQGSNFCFA